MGAASGMPKAYYEIYNNIKTKFEKTGKVAGKRYMRWEGPADQRAHMIAKSYVDGMKRIGLGKADSIQYLEGIKE